MDCPGQSIFNQREFGSTQYASASLFIIMYDINNRESFKSCGKWLQDAASVTSQHHVQGIIIANKIDLKNNNHHYGNEMVSTKEGKAFAEECGLTYFETSALSNTDLTKPFEALGHLFHTQYEKAIEKAQQIE